VPIRFINIGFNNVVVDERIIAVVSPDSSPVKRLIEVARERGSLVDGTCGRRTRSVIVTDSNHIILSALQPETISGRFKVNREKVNNRILGLSNRKNRYELKKGKRS